MAKDNTRINEQITENEVRLVGKDGEQIGVVSIIEAKRLAEEAQMDLVEIAFNAKPVVCKILDYGKYRFDKEKRDKESKKNQKITVIKEVKFKSRIDKHDLDTKIKNIEKFLEKETNKVKVSLILYGRERSHEDIGLRILDQVVEYFDDKAIVEKNYRESIKHLIISPKAVK
ncbi:MAG: translation initiation factor IF-3 [Fusobacteria bacterium]|nr:translation initiation factor IF-3 [Fusobacteriota bacterium]